MTLSRRSGSNGFTLLEAMIALVILAGVIVVSLQSRAQAIAAERSVRTKLSARGALESILGQRELGALGSPIIDPESNIQTWHGAHAGASFTLVRRPVDIPLPADLWRSGDDGALITTWRSTLTWNEATVSILEGR